MANDDELRDGLAGAMSEWALGSDSSLSLLDAVMTVVREALADAWDAGVKSCDADHEYQMAYEEQHLGWWTNQPNPWRPATAISWRGGDDAD